MSKNLLIIFTRNPELGKVKTRLAKDVGDKNALSIYKTLLQKTEQTVSNTIYDKAIYYSKSISTNDIWDDNVYRKYKQEGSNLGERMFNSFTNAFNQNYDKVLIIGSDLFHLKAQHIDKAFDALNKHDFVLGPAHDGGYYLLGMKSLYSSVFKNKNWGTSTVFIETMNDLKDQSVYLLETLNDIDVYDDLKRIKAFKKFLK